MPAIGFDPVNHAYQYLVGSRRALLTTLIAVVLNAGVGEELIWRGFLFEMLGRFIPPMRLKQHAILGTSALLFGLGHYVDQGAAGVVQATLTGFVLRRCLPGDRHHLASHDSACGVRCDGGFHYFLESRIKNRSPCVLMTRHISDGRRIRAAELALAI